MAITENDLILLKLIGISKDDFEKMDAKGQAKTLKEGIAAYAKKRALQGKPEYFENAQKLLPEIKKQFQNPPTVYYRKTTKTKGKSTTSILECQILGYSAKDNKFITINPNTSADVPNIARVSEDDIITSSDKMK